MSSPPICLPIKELSSLQVSRKDKGCKNQLRAGEALRASWCCPGALCCCYEWEARSSLYTRGVTAQCVLTLRSSSTDAKTDENRRCSHDNWQKSTIRSGVSPVSQLTGNLSLPCFPFQIGDHLFSDHLLLAESTVSLSMGGEFGHQPVLGWPTAWVGH